MGALQYRFAAAADRPAHADEPERDDTDGGRNFRLIRCRHGAAAVAIPVPARIFSYLSTWLFTFSFAAVISFISLYFYELPTHHCPFDLLQREYLYIGYPLYLSLFAAGIMGAGAGAIERFKEAPSLKSVIPALQKRLCL